MPIDFPNSPSNGATYTVGTKTWQFDGTTWNLLQGTAGIATGAVTEEKIAASAVTESKIHTSAITHSKINDGAVTEGKIASNAITTAKIADGAITAAKLGPGTGGGLDTDAEGAISIMDIGA